MRAKELVGKMAIRTAPVQYGNGNQDFSYTSDPIEIAKVTENHIVYNREMFGEQHTSILNNRWLDDNWTDYVELMDGIENGENK